MDEGPQGYSNDNVLNKLAPEDREEKLKTQPTYSEEVEEGFGDAFRSYDTIFIRDNKSLIDAVKSMPQSDEKTEKAKETN